ncbi:MAG: hypothetical protein FWC29_03510 [Methanomassiliicoccaceae archaeon]|nr:hypothetical protein [Methanomassiliicoccaceae archaeon]
MPINSRDILYMMAVFGEREQVFKTEGLVLGEFDPSVDGFYKNVQTFSFKVKKRKAIWINISSNAPVDVAVANERGASISYKQAVKEGDIGPIPTDDNKEMGIIVGVYKGDKATVSIDIWMERP